jgi:hypothetical protein
MFRIAFSMMALAALLAAQKQAPKMALRGQGSDRKVAIQAIAYLDRAEMKSVLGQDPGESIVIVQVTFTPAQGETINLVLDDFLLRSDRDGQKSRPPDRR